MISKWKVSNFKSIREETALDIAPLTIFAGANSSGKSTFLQPILLVAQTLAHRVISRSVVLNGSLARLGQFDDLRSVNSEIDRISIGWTVQPHPYNQDRREFPGLRPTSYYPLSRHVLSSVSCDISFDAEVSGGQVEIGQIQPRLLSSKLSVITQIPDEDDQKFFINVNLADATDIEAKQKWIDASDREESPASLKYDVEVDDISLAEIHEHYVTAELAGCHFDHFLPERLSVGVDRVTEDTKTILDTLGGDRLPSPFTRRYSRARNFVVPKIVLDFILDTAGRISKEARTALSEAVLRAQVRQGSKPSPNESTSLDVFIEALRGIPSTDRRKIRDRIADNHSFETLVNRAIREERKEDLGIESVPPSLAVRDGVRYLERFFSASVRYLGPLRDEPKLLYPLSPTVDPSDVGLRGEHTAAVLELHKNREIHYIPTSAFSEAAIDPQPIACSLENAVVDWLQYLGVAEGVDSRDRGKLGHELTVQISGANRSHDLTHVGVGVSQVLPILVASLLSEPDTTLIFEQPELHLHPKVQTLLGDFLLSLTQLGKQCILETHSEYLINRIRFRIAAAGDRNPWKEAVKVYFVERPTADSKFREVEINEYGAILDWPDGFFDQSQHEAEAILLASVKKRKIQKGR